MTPEGKVKVWLDRQLDVYLPGHWKVKPRGGPFGKAGTGDYIVCWQGVFIMIEVKADESCEPTALQLHQLNAVLKAGGVAAVVKGKDLDRVIKIRDVVTAMKLKT